MAHDEWPALVYADWKDTLATLHMWTQIAGKVAVNYAPPENHSWHLAMQVTPRGLATKTMYVERRPFSFEFDFRSHQLVLNTADERSATIDLEPMAVADFYELFMRMCHDAGYPVKIRPIPDELPDPIPFEQDTQHASYDSAAVERFHSALSQVDRVFREFRAGFVGKSSPSHFFWGAMDLAVTRFSGQPAPARDPKEPRFMREAYSHAVISHGFWPGNDQQHPDAAFYAYAVPEPAGFKEAIVKPAAASYVPLGEFLLPYAAVRESENPDRAILEFMTSTYEAAADRAGWDRAALEYPGGRP
jgi:hypothetical protein